MTPLELQQIIRSSVKQLRTRDHDLRATLARAERQGWDKVVAAMTQEQRLQVITMLLKTVSQKQVILEYVCQFYDHIIEQILTEAGHELESLEMHMGYEIDRAYSQSQSSGTNLLALLAAGGVGYWFGKSKS